MNTLCSKINFLTYSNACLATLSTTEVTVFGIIHVRFRKRRDQPRRAPSKIYYVRQPTPKDPEEMEYLRVALSHYNTKRKSIVSFLKSQTQPISQMIKERKTTTIDEQADLEHSFEINARWNESIAQERTIRMAEQVKKVAEIKEEKLTKHYATLEEKQLEAKERLKIVSSERRAHAIDMDRLDEELDEFLEQEPINHNFAIQESGERIN